MDSGDTLRALFRFLSQATIKHRRYCNLCERWFPTTSRHRRHLAGYQHRHIELTQRRSIHALFTLFTGKPCPRLVPANVVRSDCSVGELTPLQIAVQVRYILFIELPLSGSRMHIISCIFYNSFISVIDYCIVNFIYYFLSQDVTKCFDRTQQSPRKENDVDK